MTRIRSADSQVRLRNAFMSVSGRGVPSLYQREIERTTTMHDIHTHLYWESYDADRDAVIARAHDAGIDRMFAIGCTVEESRQCVALAERYSEVYASVGIHPHFFNDFVEKEFSISNFQFSINDQNPNDSMKEKSFYSTINIKNEQFERDFTPVDPTCDCTLCTKYTRAYLKHLLKVGEPLALRLASEHNLRFYMRLMEQLRSKA